MIEFRDVTKVYESNGTKALNNVNIKIDDGEFVFVVGSSGAGKSTFLKLIMHEEKPTEGTSEVLPPPFGPVMTRNLLSPTVRSMFFRISVLFPI